MSQLADLRAGRFAGQSRLDLSCGLTEFPPEIYQLADTLEVLNLSGNDLRALPDDLPRLRRLRVLFCSDNLFEELPPVLGQCERLETIGFRHCKLERLAPTAFPARLRSLVLTDNRIESLPASLARCEGLQKLMLAGNRLRELPEAMAACHQLELLRLAANRFEALPAWLAGLPRLTWLAAAGNPMTAAREAASSAQPMADVDWAELELHEVLGTGASGVIHRATCSGGTPVAAKLFKSAVTSDGLPRSELAACIAAGDHPNLIGVLGRIRRHPEGTQGLVMRLIPPAFQTLAGPPSLASCTRDSYADEARFSAVVTWRLATDVATATAHLHARGLLHGDLYAHNILCHAAGDAVLGDLGAASFAPAAGDAQPLHQLEVRAFGVLLGELLQRCHEAPGLPLLEALRALQARCVQPAVAARPLFAEIVDRLRAAAAVADR